MRVIAANASELETAVNEGRLREDLYFRLSVVQLRVPPLRQRREDLPLLVRALLSPHARPEFELSPALLERLRDYAWPDNVRELQDLIERALLVAGVDIRRNFKGEPDSARDALVDAFAREYFQMVLQRFGPAPAEIEREAGIAAASVEQLRRKWKL